MSSPTSLQSHAKIDWLLLRWIVHHKALTLGVSLMSQIISWSPRLQLSSINKCHQPNWWTFKEPGVVSMTFSTQAIRARSANLHRNTLKKTLARPTWDDMLTARQMKSSSLRGIKLPRHVSSPSLLSSLLMSYRLIWASKLAGLPSSKLTQAKWKQAI